MNTDRHDNVLVSLALLGVVFVGSVAFFSLVFDTNREEETHEVQEVQEEESTSYDFEAQNYGIAIKELKEWSLREVELSQEDVIDCRKMSSVMRDDLLANGSNCYEIMLTNDAIDGYVAVTTGTKYHEDTHQRFILKDKEAKSLLREYPSAFVNLPLEQIYVSGFPVTFNGTQVVYDSGVSFTFYEGIVYKGADKYAILVKGELDDSVRDMLDEVVLE